MEADAFDILNLSVQELVDCDTAADQGCTGGNPLLAFYFIHRYGLAKWSDYPYTGSEDTCKTDAVKHPVATVKSWGVISPNHEKHMELVLRYIGPIAVGVNGASSSFLAYRGGIFDRPGCKQGANHALLITGYGQEVQPDGNITRFWYARNSWGAGWGENGYVRVKRGDGGKGTLGVCGIARSPSVALGGVLLPKESVEATTEAFGRFGINEGPAEHVCDRLGLNLSVRCEKLATWADDHKALSLAMVGIFIALLAVIPLTRDCKRRQRLRQLREQRRSVERERLRLSEVDLEKVETDPLAPSGENGASYGTNEKKT